MNPWYIALATIAGGALLLKKRMDRELSDITITNISYSSDGTAIAYTDHDGKAHDVYLGPSDKWKFLGSNVTVSHPVATVLTKAYQDHVATVFTEAITPKRKRL